MSDRDITPNPIVKTLVCGHFKEDRTYKNWRPRGTTDWLLIGTVDGAGRFGFETGSFVASAGEFVLIRPGAMHDYSTAAEPGRWEILWAHFRPPTLWLDLLDWPELAPGIMHLGIIDHEARNNAMRSLSETVALASSIIRRRERFAMNSLERMLLWCDMCFVDVEQVSGSSEPQMDPRISESMEFLRGSLSEEISLEALAKRSGLSVSRYSHLFHDQSGATPQKYLENQRMERAGELLVLSGYSVAEIAAEVGYQSPFYFSMRFKKYSGACPRDYRNRYR